MKLILALIFFTPSFVVAILNGLCHSNSVASTWTGFGRSKGVFDGTDIAISTVSVLLPQDPNVSFLVEAYNGCFKWTVSNPKIAELRVEDEKCGSSVYISASKDIETYKSSQEDHLRVWLIAEEKTSSRSLRTEVYFDDIHKIRISTTSRNLYKDDAQVLQIQAYDKEGNLFSSVEGLEFDWDIQMDDSVKSSSASFFQSSIESPSTVLAIQPFHNQHIEVTDLLIQMESVGKHSGAILIKAIATGKSRVTCKLIGEAFASVAPSNVSLNVLEPLQLNPSNPVYLAPYSTFEFHLETFEKGLIKPILMPNTQYKWRLLDPKLAYVSDTGVVETTNLIGSTNLEVQFIPVEDNIAFSTIYVRPPEVLGIHFFSANENISISHYLIVNTSYWLKLVLYDKEGHELEFSKNTKFDLIFDSDFFSVTNISATQHLSLVTPLKEGISQIKTSTSQIRNSKGTWPLKNPIKTYKDMIILKPITLTPTVNKIVLPWSDSQKHSFKFKASGGSGTYTFSSSNLQVATVNEEGLVILNAIGNCTVTCTDERQPLNFVVVEVEVLEPKGIALYPTSRNAIIGTELILAVSLFPNELDGEQEATHELKIEDFENSFDNCSLLNLNWAQTKDDVFSQPESVSCDILENKIKTINEDGDKNKVFNFKKACACFNLKALKEGYSKLAVSYTDLQTQKVIQTSVILGSFHQVRVVPSRLLVTYGSSAEFSIFGGPQTLNFNVPVVPNILPSKPNEISIKMLQSISGPSNIWKYHITCLSHGEQNISIAFGNSALPMDLVSFKTEILFQCKLPKALMIVPFLTLSNSDSYGVPNCMNPLLRNLDERKIPLEPSNPMPRYNVRTGTPMVINLVMVDNNGNVFDNYSTLSIKWTSSNTSLLSLSQKSVDFDLYSSKKVNMMSENHPDPLKTGDTSDEGDNFKDFENNHYKYYDSNNNSPQWIDSVSSFLSTFENRTIDATEYTGSAFIRIKVTHLDVSKLSLPHISKTPTISLDHLVQEFEINFMHNLILQPVKMSLYNDPKNIQTLEIKGGSGFYIIESNNTALLNVKYEKRVSAKGDYESSSHFSYEKQKSYMGYKEILKDEKNKQDQQNYNQIVIQPLGFGVVDIRASDECLLGSFPVHSKFFISPVHDIILESSPICQTGHHLEIKVKVLDENRDAFNLDQFYFMDLQVHIEGAILGLEPSIERNLVKKVKMAHDYSYRLLSDHFLVLAKSEGFAAISVSITTKSSDCISDPNFSSNIFSKFTKDICSYGNQNCDDTFTDSSSDIIGMISSTPIQIQVYPPLNVRPTKLDLHPGSSFQLDLSGGPLYHSDIIYSFSEKDFITVNKDGVIQAKSPGEVFLNVLMRKIDISSPEKSRQSGDKDTSDEILAKETVHITVKELQGISIHVPTTQILKGESLVVRVVGQNGESPFVWSGLDLTFKWEVSNPDVIGLSSFAPLGADQNLDEGKGYIVKLKALAPGTSTLSVRVVSGPPSLNAKFASTKILVIPILGPIKDSETTSSQILLSPGARYNLRTTMPASVELIKEINEEAFSDESTSKQAGKETSNDDGNEIVGNKDSRTGDFKFKVDQLKHDYSIVSWDSKNQHLVSSGMAGVSFARMIDTQFSQVSFLQINVKPIHHLELLPISENRGSSIFETDYQFNLPVGNFIDYEIILREKFGKKFDSYSDVNFEWLTNKQDVISVEILRGNESFSNPILRLKGISEGTVIILVQAFIPNISLNFKYPATNKNRVTASNYYNYNFNTFGSNQSNLKTSTELSHYHYISVSNAILPIDPLVHVGGVINFFTSFTPDPSYRKVWNTPDTDIITIDPITGVANAINTGKTVIFHNSSVYTSTNVQVSTIDHIKFSKCSKLTNLPYYSEASHECLLKMKFFDSKNIEFINSENINHNIKPRCSVPEHFEEFLSIEDRIDECLIKIKVDSKSGATSDSDSNSKIKFKGRSNFENKNMMFKDRSNNMNCNGNQKCYNHLPVQDHLQIFIHTGEGNHIKNHSVEIPFVSSFWFVSPRQIYLSPSFPTYMLYIESTTTLQVAISDPSKISVQLDRHINKNHTLVYKVQVVDLKYPFSLLPIEFINPETKQTEILLTSFGKTKAKSPGFSSASSNEELESNVSFFFITIGIITSIIIAMYFLATLKH